MENNKEVSCGSYVNGKKQGIWLEYYFINNVKYMERCHYDNGIKYGLSKIFDLSHRVPIEVKKDKAKEKLSRKFKNAFVKHRDRKKL